MSAKRHLNGVLLVCQWWPSIESWLGSFVVFKWIRTSIAKKPYIFVIFQGGVRTPCPPLWIRTCYRPLGHWKRGSFDNHIFAWFICSRWEIRFFLFGEQLISCLSSANIHAFHENSNLIYHELNVLSIKAHITKSWLLMSSAEIFEASNSVDPDQTAPIGAVWAGSTLLASILMLNNKHTFFQM